MKPLHFLVALIASCAATVLSLGSSTATEYQTNPNPACRLMRNNTPGAPFPREPNRADARTAMSLGGSVKSSLDNLPEFRKRFAKAFPLMQKIDAEGTTALSELPPSTARIDLVIDKHLINLIWTRSMLTVFYEEGRDPRQVNASKR